MTALYMDNFAVFSRQRLDGLWSAAARERLGALSPYATAERYYESSDARTMLNKLLYVDTKTYLHELLRPITHDFGQDPLQCGRIELGCANSVVRLVLCPPAEHLVIQTELGELW